MINADEILFRCSSLGYLMTKPRSKTETLSETTKTHLIDVFVSANYHRREELKNKFVDKGNAREEDSITLLSRVRKIMLRKNNIRLSNKFITGELDIFLGESVENADETFDTKTSWSAHTYFRSKFGELNELYRWQGQGYMWLSNAKKHTVAHCLVNGTDTAILQEKRSLAWKMGVDVTSMTNDYVVGCKQVEINHIFDMPAFVAEYPHFDFHNNIAEWKYDIPMIERLHTFEIERSDEDIATIESKVVESRKWIKETLLKTP